MLVLKGANLVDSRRLNTLLANTLDLSGHDP